MTGWRATTRYRASVARRPTPATRAKTTATSNFGVGRREGHDASAFYARFEPPVLTSDDTVLDPADVTHIIGDPCKCADATDMADVPDGSVALVVTSPPYFAGKQYEEELGAAGVPSSYAEYLRLLEAVFAECVRTLEPGGRIAVNVANLGRKPYRSLSADVTAILQDRLHLLMRGEVLWRKQDGASGNCAWGSYRSPSNPSIRDVTERVLIASKGRFDRAKSAKERAAVGLPHRSTLAPDRFLAATLDVWEIPPERASRVGHPAPFPVELPEALIDLYTYEDDLVLDPLMGSGSALVAAARRGRRYVGYDLDPAYVAIARARLSEEGPTSTLLPEDDAVTAGRAEASERSVGPLTERVLVDAGFVDVRKGANVRGTGCTVSFGAADALGDAWLFDVAGSFASPRDGLRKMDDVWRALGRATAVAGRRSEGGPPLVLLTSYLPRLGSKADLALRAAGPTTFFDAVAVLSDDGPKRLANYAAGGFTGHDVRPVPGFW